MHYGKCESGAGLLGSGSSISREKTWIFPPSQSTNCAWGVFGIITEMGAWVVASNWLGWTNAAICMKLSIQAWWSSFIVSVYLKRNASPYTATPPLRKKSIFVLHTGYWMKNIFSPSYRKISTLIFLVTLYSNDISSAFTGLCRFLQNFYWTAAF